MPASDSAAVGESMTARAVSVLLMMFLPLVFLEYLFQSFGLTPSIIKAAGVFIAAGCFLVGSGALVFTGVSKRKALIWVTGVLVELGVLAVSATSLVFGLPVGDFTGLLIVGGVVIAGAFLVQEVQFRSAGRPRPMVTTGDSGLALSVKRVLLPEPQGLVRRQDPAHTEVSDAAEESES